LSQTSLQSIIKDPEQLLQFTLAEQESFNQLISTKETKAGNAYFINCLKRNKEIKLTPEEVIRQLFLAKLINHYKYPLDRIEVEKGITFGSDNSKRADIVVLAETGEPYIIFEVKQPNRKDGKAQLKSYCHATGCPIAVWSNGKSISYYHRKDPNYFQDITNIPVYQQSLADILCEKFTMDDLIAKDKLKNERKSLKDLILDMEDEVLANAGVDSFEEVFKLIFAKLFDEWSCSRNDKTKNLQFRNTGQTENELKDKIQELFNSANTKWQGVFKDNEKLILSASHLSICVASLENVKLFNSNLDVIDDAFEYLMSKSSKGEKGQYFTPRYVIDMAVKMLNPQEHEYLIDTAAGSAGFTMHAIFHVWKAISQKQDINCHLITANDRPDECTDYVKDKVFAIDFDEKAVRVARTLNIIAGDGQTNCLHLNTLDYERWDEWIKHEGWNDLYNDGFKKLKALRETKNSNQYFKFDVLLANPPFAGDIKETKILSRYDLGKKNGKTQNKVGRDILFIERNLQFLKPGGRMAVVLPQGRFNNSSDQDIRNYIAERCRILAVIGLHANVFKPHTGTKTSVLLVQKWDDELCPKTEDYNIFFATMREPSKDNGGEKLYVKDEYGKHLLDSHDHLIVKHDLFNHDGKTQDGIAEAFTEFAKKENLSFIKDLVSKKA
jgi:type I restriction enzyme M protein